MVNKLLYILIVMTLISCFNREHNHIKVNFNPVDSSINVNDSSFYIRKVIIENNFGKKFYVSNSFNNNKFIIFSDKSKVIKRLILDSINVDTLDKYIYVQVAKRGDDGMLINFNSVPFRKFTGEITIEKEKTPFP